MVLEQLQGDTPAGDGTGVAGDRLAIGAGRTPTGGALYTFAAFVVAGAQATSPLEEVRHQVFPGDDTFVARFTDAKRRDELSEVSRAQRRPLARPLAAYADAYPRRDEAMAQGYRGGGYTMKEIAKHFGVHYMTVSRAMRKFEQTMLECEN